MNTGREESIKMEDGYMPQLDALRAIAVGLVIIQHWFYGFKIFNFLPEGEIGVKLFFVLSGFLITRILLNYKNMISSKNTSFKQCIKKFYFRRFLRIFPIYYILLIVLLISNSLGIQDSFFWHFFYLSNFYFYYILHGWGNFAHFWSLSVEEQFYIFWPFVILLTKEKYLFTTILFTIIVGIIFRCANFDHSYMFNVLTPACFDALGLGALLSLKYSGIVMYIQKIGEKYFIFLLLNFGLIIVFYIFKFTVFNQIFLGLFISLFSFLIVAKLSMGIGWGNFFFENKVLIYLGKISYGIYLYHTLIPFIYIAKVNIFFSYLYRFVLLLLVSSTSYYFIERPILKLKNKG